MEVNAKVPPLAKKPSPLSLELPVPMTTRKNHTNVEDDAKPQVSVVHNQHARLKRRKTESSQWWQKRNILTSLLCTGPGYKQMKEQLLGTLTC